jgi:uncharacterized metal-binding protein YceD (DUF177 family)
MEKPAPILSVPLRVDEVPETGRRVTVAADAPVRSALARAAGLLDLPRFEATFEVARHGRGGLHVSGRISATVRQTCVVTLDEIDNEIDEAVDLTFVAGPRHDEPTKQDGDSEGTGETPEVLVNGTVDLGAIATEFLILAIDPYPRKSDAVFVAPSAGPSGNHPFAALAALKKPGR